MRNFRFFLFRKNPPIMKTEKKPDENGLNGKRRPSDEYLCICRIAPDKSEATGGPDSAEGLAALGAAASRPGLLYRLLLFPDVRGSDRFPRLQGGLRDHRKQVGGPEVLRKILFQLLLRKNVPEHLPPERLRPALRLPGPDSPGDHAQPAEPETLQGICPDRDLCAALYLDGRAGRDDLPLLLPDQRDHQRPDYGSRRKSRLLYYGARMVPAAVYRVGNLAERRMEHDPLHRDTDQY